MANVPPGQRTRVRKWMREGVYPEDYKEVMTGNVSAHPFGDESPIQDIVYDSGMDDVSNITRVVDPKTGAVLSSGRTNSDIAYDTNPAVEHGQPSHPDAVELPPKTKCFYDLLHLQSRQINLLGKMMKVLIGVKMAGPIRESSIDEDAQIIPPNPDRQRQFAPHIDQSKWYDQDPAPEGEEAPDPFGRDELNNYDWGPDMYRLPDGRLAIEGRETPPKEQ